MNPQSPNREDVLRDAQFTRQRIDGRVIGQTMAAFRKTPPRLLVSVKVQRSFGAVKVLMCPEDNARDLIRACLDIYEKEKRRPFLMEKDPKSFELHYSQFSLECLNPDEKLINLGSRNFFLCLKPSSSTRLSCSNVVNNVIASPIAFTKFMDFLL